MSRELAVLRGIKFVSAHCRDHSYNAPDARSPRFYLDTCRAGGHGWEASVITVFRNMEPDLPGRNCSLIIAIASTSYWQCNESRKD